MLNINQNFDLKAPVFNFDRDYFNSVEELKAYDTSNVPNHFVTNVAGMLYQYTGGKWLPMISTVSDDTNYYINLGCENAYIYINENSCPSFLGLQNEDDSVATLTPTSLDLDNDSRHVSIDADYHKSTAGIILNSDNDSSTVITDNYINCGDDNKNIRLGTTESKTFGLTMQDTTSKGVQILVDKQYTDEGQDDYSPVDLSLIDNEFSAKINAKDGFIHKTDDDFISGFNGYTLYAKNENRINIIDIGGFSIMNDDKNVACIEYAHIDKDYKITLGSNEKFKIYGSDNDTNGTTITGVESITAFSNPSATKVWATDGSTVNMPTKFSDLKNDSIYITGNKGETDAKFKIYYNQGNVLRSKLQYAPRHAGVGIPELALVSYDTSGHNLSQLRIRPDDNRDNGQYLIQVQNVIGDTINYVSTLATENVSLQNFKNNTSVDLKSDELIFYGDPQGEQIQLKINKEGIIKTNGKSTEVFAADGSTVDLSTYTNYFNGTTTADKLKAKAVEVTDNTNSVAVSPTGITATNGSATKVFATDGSIADLSTKANASDVLLKKNTSDGYYIDYNDNEVGLNSFAANNTCTASSMYAFAEGYYTETSGNCSHVEGSQTISSNLAAHAEGCKTEAKGECSHAEGWHTIAKGYSSHAQGSYNIEDNCAIHSIGIGINNDRKNAEYIYAQTNETGDNLIDDPKNGYKYLIGVGGYDGISTDITTYKSVQEVIADLTARIEQLEKLQNQKTL